MPCMTAQIKIRHQRNLKIDGELYIKPKSVIKAFYIGLEWFSNDRH